MLGIVFTGGKSPPPELIRAELAGQNDALTAAADSGLDTALLAGVSPHWIIGDMDSLADPARLETYPAEQIIRHPPDKDYTDTELACEFLWKQGCGDIWIIGGGGGRIDHLFGIRSLFERTPFPRRWLSDTADIYCIEAGGGEAGLSLCLESGALVSVFPLGTGPWRASSRGLKWPLDNLPWSKRFFGLSNVAQNGKLMIHSLQGRFMVLIPHKSLK